jgi:hypothetical protein
MKRSIVTALVVLAATACNLNSTADLPSFTGTIQSSTFKTLDDHTFGDIQVSTGPRCEDQVIFNISSRNTRLVRRDGVLVSPESLTVGRRVSVQYSGPLALSCPPQGGAEVVTVDP